MIVSASRRTDIPRWYAPWLMNRLRAGEVMVREPYRPHRLRRYALTPEGVDAVVFWTKDPRPLLPPSGRAGGNGLPGAVPVHPHPLRHRHRARPGGKGEILAAFQALGRRLGRERVLWRYDPVLLTGAIGADWHPGNGSAYSVSGCSAVHGSGDPQAFWIPTPAGPWTAMRAPDHREAAELAIFRGDGPGVRPRPGDVL